MDFVLDYTNYYTDTKKNVSEGTQKTDDKKKFCNRTKQQITYCFVRDRNHFFVSTQGCRDGIKVISVDRI